MQLNELSEGCVKSGEMNLGTILKGKSDRGFTGDGVRGSFSELVDDLGLVYFAFRLLFISFTTVLTSLSFSQRILSLV